MRVQIPAYVCFRLKGRKWWGTYLTPASSMFVTYNSCVPSAHLERRDQSSTIQRSPYASSDDFE